MGNSPISAGNTIRFILIFVINPLKFLRRRFIWPESSMLLLRTKIRDTISARDNVFGYTIDLAMEMIIGLGGKPNKTLNETAPKIKLWPNDSFFRIKKSTKTNTMIIRIIAGICSKIAIQYQFNSNVIILK
jgi:hypothetical protein